MQKQQQQSLQPSQPPHGPALTNIDSVLEGTVNKFVRSEKYARKIKYIVRGTSVPGRQNYKFAPATALTPQETRIWRQNLMQDEIASNNPFWTARWMRVFGVAPKLDDSLLKVPWIKCERTKAPGGDARTALPLHRKETYLDLRDEQNRNWAMDSYAMGIRCAQNGQLENALKAYSQSIQIDNKSVDAYLARGCTLANMSKFKEAIMDFRQALTLQPSNDQAQRYLDSTMAREEHMRLNVEITQCGQAEIDKKPNKEQIQEPHYQDTDKEPRGEEARCQYSNTSSVEKSCQRSIENSVTEKAKEPCTPYTTSIQDSLAETHKESCTSYTSSVQDAFTETIKESSTIYTASIQESKKAIQEPSTAHTTSIQEPQKASKESSTAYTTPIQESQKAVKISRQAANKESWTEPIQEPWPVTTAIPYATKPTKITLTLASSSATQLTIPLTQPWTTLPARDSKNENDAKNLKDSDTKDAKEPRDPKDFKEDKSNKDSNLASKGEQASSSKKVESTDDTVYFMRANIDAQKELKTDAKDDKDTTNTKDATKTSRETKGKDDKNGSKRPMEESRQDEDSKRNRTRSPEHDRRSPHHNNLNHRDRSHSHSRSETRDDSKSGGRRRPLPSQSDLRRAQTRSSK
ncbi:hypothetical protein BG000_010726 [Podila horticola]|nr:hypothetical protein BG000_010726 [Podila horticola]